MLNIDKEFGRRLGDVVDYVMSNIDVRYKKDIADLIGGNLSNLSRAIRGDMRYSKTYAKRICMNFKNINYDWIESGEGEMINGEFQNPLRDLTGVYNREKYSDESIRRIREQIIKIMRKNRILTFKEFSEIIGVHRTSLSRAMNGDTTQVGPIIKNTCAKYPEFDVEYVMSGNTDTAKNDDVEHENDLFSSVESSNDEECAEPSNMTTPIINTSALGRIKSADEIDERDVLGRINFYGASDGEFCVRMVGDSMQPVIMSGALMLVRPISGWREFVEFGNVYLMTTADGRTIVRTIQQSKIDNEHFMCFHGINNIGVEFPKSAFTNMFLVKSVINSLAM